MGDVIHRLVAGQDERQPCVQCRTPGRGPATAPGPQASPPAGSAAAIAGRSNPRRRSAMSRSSANSTSPAATSHDPIARSPHPRQSGPAGWRPDTGSAAASFPMGTRQVQRAPPRLRPIQPRRVLRRTRPSWRNLLRPDRMQPGAGVPNTPNPSSVFRRAQRCRLRRRTHPGGQGHQSPHHVRE